MHLNNDTLELLALNQSFPSRDLARMRRHLASCVQCRERLEEIRQFYAAADAEVAEARREEINAPTALPAVRRENTLLQTIFDQSVSVRRPPQRILDRLTIFWKSRPFAAGLGGALLVGALGVGLVSLFQSPRDTNPAYASVNPDQLSMNVYNQRDQVLWSKPIWVTGAQLLLEKDRREHMVQVVDLDRDGRREVVTTYKLSRDGGSPLSSSVAVFNADGSLRAQRQLSAPVSYRGATFDSTFDSKGLLAYTPPGAAESEIVVCAQNRRSPFAFVRLSAGLQLLGTYWHFGHLHGPAEVPAPSGGKLLVLWGVDDLADAEGLTRSTLVVIDPSRMNGSIESSATPGFGHPVGDAEAFVIRFPDPDILVPLEAQSSLRRIEAVTPHSLHVVQLLTVDGRDLPGLEYVFDLTWKLTGIKPISGFEQQHQQLALDGKISSTFGQAYLDALARRLQYWDGRSWTSAHTRVQPPRAQENLAASDPETGL